MRQELPNFCPVTFAQLISPGVAASAPPADTGLRVRGADGTVPADLVTELDETYWPGTARFAMARISASSGRPGWSANAHTLSKTVA